MARSVKAQIEVLVKDNATGPLGKLAKKFQEAEKQAAKASGGIAKFDASLAKMQAVVSGVGQTFGTLAAVAAPVIGLFAALGAALAVVTVKAAGFSKRIAEITTLLPNAEIATQTLRDSVLDLSTTFGSGAEDQARALYQAISAGATDAASAQKVLLEANKLAVGGVTTVENAVDGLTSVMNAFGLQQAQLTAVSDQFFAAMRFGKTTVGELSKEIGRLAPIARAAGINIQEMFAAVSAITKVGIRTDQAVVSTSQLLTAFLKPTKQARDEAERLGIEFNVATLKTRGLRGALESITKSAKFNDETLAKLFGNIRAQRAVFGLLSREGGLFRESLENQARAAGATEDAVGKMMNTLSNQASRVGAAFSKLIIKLGETIADNQELIDSVKELADTLDELGDSIDSVSKRISEIKKSKFGEFISDVTDQALASLSAFNPFKGAIDGLKGSFDFLKLAFTDFNEISLKGTDNLNKFNQAASFKFIPAKVPDSGPSEEELEKLKRQQKLIEGLKNRFEDLAPGVRNAAADFTDFALLAESRFSPAVFRTGQDLLAALKNLEKFARVGDKVEFNRTIKEIKKLQTELNNLQKSVVKEREVELDAAKFREQLQREAAERIRENNKRAAEVELEDRKLQHKRLEEAEKEALKNQNFIATRATNFLFNTFSSAFDGVIQGTKTLGQAFVQLGKSIVKAITEAIVKLLLFKALTAIFSGGTSLVAAGPAGALGGLLGGVLGFNKGGMVPKFAGGGFVSGGTPGRDSVPAMLTPGEFVLPKNVVDTIKSSIPSTSNKFNTGGLVGGNNIRGGSNTVVIQTLSVPDRAQFRRQLRDSLVPELKELKRNGVKF